MSQSNRTFTTILTEEKQMIPSTRGMHFHWLALTVAVLALVAVIAPASAEESGTAAEIKAMIMADSEYARANLKDQEGGVSQHGSLEFWSSGGLMQWSAPDGAISEYDKMTITPKHIEVIELPGGESAVAMYYSEGTMARKGAPAVTNYFTRVLQVFVKEDGKWVARAAHWSPVQGGAGTNQTAVE
jgi:hypothetical protein